MHPRAFEAYNLANFEVPVPPQKFGEDGGKFYRHYDALAEEMDNDMVTGLKEQLEGLLIFAGLFAGVNTAFLALTLPLMSPDPADDTNALLRDNNLILLNLALGRNDSLPSTNPLPSETFSPTGKVLTVNVLFSVSLTFAIVASFLAVLGRQWLVYYRKRGGGGPEGRRWEQLRRFLGVERWRLEWVLDDWLPSLLQMGLIIFSISLTIYLDTLHTMLSTIVGAFMSAGVAIMVITAIFATWDKFCPFQSPLSHTLSHLLPLVRYIALALGQILLIPIIAYSITLWLFQRLLWTMHAHQRRRVHGPSSVTLLMDYFYRSAKWTLTKYYISPINSLLRYMVREEEWDGVLQITAIRRAICTTDDARTQNHAVSNIIGIMDGDLLSQLVTDEDFRARISDLAGSSYSRTLQLCGRNRSNLAAETSWLYRAALTHVRLLVADPGAGEGFGFWGTYWSTFEESMPLHSLDIIQRAPPNMLTAWLGYLADSRNRYPSQARHSALGFIIDVLVNPSWRCISMAIVTITVTWGINNSDHETLHAAYTGEPSVALQNLNLVVQKVNDPHCPDRDTLSKYIVKIMKLTGKAAIDSSVDSSGRLNEVAGLLSLVEGVVRGKASPSNLLNAGRNLRVDLIRALQSDVSKETLDELIHLFTELTPAPDPDSHEDEAVGVSRHPYSYNVTVGGRPTRTLSWDDDEELVQLFASILQQLNAIMIKNARDPWGNRNTEQDYLGFRRQVEELKLKFANFKAVVNSATREFKVTSFLDVDYSLLKYKCLCRGAAETPIYGGATITSKM
ncbi:hypothetical protein FRC00_002706 [Tulasnella sp. 408]|nr:hypothetical protein FRC00_002706 [Tulasnella sp. 408]